MGFVQDFVDGVSRSGNQRAENFGVGAEMMIFKRGVKHLVHRGVDAVSLLPGGLNTKRPFREVTGAAENAKFLKHHDTGSMLHGSAPGGKSPQTAADNHNVSIDGLGFGPGRARNSRQNSSRDQIPARNSEHNFSLLSEPLRDECPGSCSYYSKELVLWL